MILKTQDEIEQSLLDAGVSASRASLLAARAKPCAWLETFNVDTEDAIPVGRTKIGGRPDLLPSMRWPYRPPYPDASRRIAERAEIARGVRNKTRIRDMMAQVAVVAEPRPLSFIAQVDLAEVCTVAPIEPDIPRGGRLLLFYDTDQQPWGFRPGDVVSGTVLYDNSSTGELRPRDHPEKLESFAPLRCVPHAAMAPVPLWGYDYPVTGPNDPDHEPFCRWYWEVLSPEPGRGSWHDHRVGGHPNQIQRDMQRECQLVSHGLDLGSPDSYDHTVAANLEAGSKDWLLLLQIASDDKNGMMWGDLGNLYVWIHRADLKDRRFGKARVILQCS